MHLLGQLKLEVVGAKYSLIRKKAPPRLATEAGPTSYIYQCMSRE